MRVLILAAALVAALCWPARAGERIPTTMVCDLTELLQAVPGATGGQIVAVGPAGDLGKALGQLVISPNGDWAFFLEMPDGYSCALASGHDWTEITPIDLMPAGNPT